MREVVYFPDQKITENTVWKRKTASKVVRDDSISKNFERKIVVTFPDESEHNHLVGEVRFLCLYWAFALKQRGGDNVR